MQAGVAAWALFSLIASVPVTAQTTYQEELSVGVRLYKEARFEDAGGHFRNATVLDPQQEQAHFYLATTYAQQYVPGLASPDNLQFAESAITEYQKVLALDPQSVSSLKGIALLYLNMQKFDDAKSFYQKATGVDGKDPETYYSIGVIDWTEAYARSMRLRKSLKKLPDQTIIDAVECWDLREANQATVEDGIKMMVRAIELRPNYDDAMAYMNLLYRQKADIDCSDPGADDSDLRAADHWMKQCLDTRKALAEKSADPNRESPDANPPPVH